MTEAKIQRLWAIPNRWTFTIYPIKRLLQRYVKDGVGWIDPFAGFNSPAEYTNDLNPKAPTNCHLKATDFITRLDKRQMFQGVLFDPPYSPRQIQECYNEVGLKPTQLETSTIFHSEVKDLLANRIIPGGFAISFGWNSNGFGINRGFEIVEILLVPHGGMHNDTIVVVEKKVSERRQRELTTTDETEVSGAKALRTPPTTEVVGIRAGDIL